MSATARQRRINQHVARLQACTLCPKMHRPPVSGGPVLSKVMIVGQAPGAKEPVLGRPFAWTAGKTLFGWFERACGMTEAEFRRSIYMAAVCRCFPGKTKAGGDRVPDPIEIATCADWIKAELEIIEPALVIPIGALAIRQFVPFDKLAGIIGQRMAAERFGRTFDLIPLPHPSGASPWHRIEPGKTLLGQALRHIVHHPAWPKGSAHDS